MLLLLVVQMFDVNVWHARLGHIGHDRLKRLATNGLLGSLANIDMLICESCFTGKATRKPFGKETRAEKSIAINSLSHMWPN